MSVRIICFSTLQTSQRYTFTSSIFFSNFTNLLTTSLMSQGLSTFHCLPRRLSVTFRSSDHSGMEGIQEWILVCAVQGGSRGRVATDAVIRRLLSNWETKRAVMKKLRSPSKQCDSRWKTKIQCVNFYREGAIFYAAVWSLSAPRMVRTYRKCLWILVYKFQMLQVSLS